MKKIIAVLDNIVVEKITDTETKSGIVLPEYAQSNTQERAEGKGKVIAVGNGIRKLDGTLTPLMVKKGDIIYFSKYIPVKIDEKDYLLTKEVYVLIIIEEIKDEKISKK